MRGRRLRRRAEVLLLREEAKGLAGLSSGPVPAQLNPMAGSRAALP